MSCPFARRDNNVIHVARILRQNFYISFSRTTCPFARRDNNIIARKHRQNVLNLFLRNHLTDFIQTWHTAFWVKELQVSTIERPWPFPRGKIPKNIIQRLKISKTIGPISTKFGTRHPWEKGTQVILIKEHSFLK